MAKRMRTSTKAPFAPVPARTRVPRIVDYELANNVKVIKVNDQIIDDEDYFLRLINEKNNDVERLHLINVTFDQQFYDKLPVLCNQINYLKVEHASDSAIINCDFVLKFRRLKHFSINQHLSPQLMDCICSNFAEELKEIGFMYRERRAKILLFDRDDYPGRERDEDFNPVGLQIERFVAEFDDFDRLFGFLTNIL